MGESGDCVCDQRVFQLATMLGVEKETGNTLGYFKYNWQEHGDHFILADTTKEVDFGEGMKSIYAYVENGKYCVVNNTYVPQSTTIYKGDGSSFDLDLKENEIIWYEI